MRPVARGKPPVGVQINSYRDAFDYLLMAISTGTCKKGRIISHYCSYCERTISTNLAVEHIEPKSGDHAKAELENIWSNFLLACVNCNSTKGAKAVDFKQLYFPDRDNTYFALTYLPNGQIIPNIKLSRTDQEITQNTIELLGLNKSLDTDVNGVAKDRRSQRINVWLTALDCLEDFSQNPKNKAVQNIVIREMLSNGFFSIWMAVFSKHIEMKNAFIDAISGTRASGCFDEHGSIVSPHPNTDKLEDGGKI